MTFNVALRKDLVIASVAKQSPALDKIGTAFNLNVQAFFLPVPNTDFCDVLFFEQPFDVVTNPSGDLLVVSMPVTEAGNEEKEEEAAVSEAVVAAPSADEPAEEAAEPRTTQPREGDA